MLKKFKMILAQSTYRNNQYVKPLSEGQFIKKYSTQIESVADVFFRYDILLGKLSYDAKFLSMVIQSLCQSPGLCDELSMVMIMSETKSTKPCSIFQLLACVVSHTHLLGTFKPSPELLYYISQNHYDYYDK